ncbi:16S rRNA (uracil(1498)-N(3))-methyltransferase, partial [Candidatus Parcubacteria bacterium]|nr:16S rRNA (uracil(1498)-N(3))-methyltransferase [Candidatus Parcubacteria bacterium]
MRIHRFFVPSPIEGKEVTLTDPALLHQWEDVLKLKTGEKVILFDGRGCEFLAVISELGPSKATLAALSRREGGFPARNLWLFVAIPKKDKLEWIAEKATELGVTHLVPVLADRSEKKGFNDERLRKISVEAAEQSGRMTLMSLHGTFTLEEALRQHNFSLLACDITGVPLAESVSPEKTLGIFIGPEGGWSERELSMFNEKKIPLV